MRDPNPFQLPIYRIKARGKYAMGPVNRAARLPRAITRNANVSTALACLTLCIGLISLTGCGYTTEELFPEQYQTVAAPIFENETFYKGVEFDLAEAVSKQIESRTPYKLASQSKADTLLTGTITDVDQGLVSRTRQGNLPELLEVTMTVNFEWRDLRTGKVILDRQGFDAIGQYVPANPVAEPLESAQHGAVERLAQDIVSTMRGGW